MSQEKVITEKKMEPMLNRERERITEKASKIYYKQRIDADRICDKHDVRFEEMEYDTYRCPSCEREKRENGEFNMAVWIAPYELALPSRLKRYSFDSFHPIDEKSRKVFDICKGYVERWPDVGGMLMLGGVGTGKTHLAVSICRELPKWRYLAALPPSIA